MRISARLLVAAAALLLCISCVVAVGVCASDNTTADDASAQPVAASSGCMLLQTSLGSIAPVPLLMLLWVLRTGAYIMAALLFVVWWNQGSLLYMPSFGRVGEGKVLSANPRGFRSPAEYGLRHEDVWLMSGAVAGVPGSGTPIHSWLVLQPGALAERAPTLLFFHGNAGNIGYRLGNVRALVQACGCNVMIVDYRGYGCSAGEPSESGLIDDALAALDYLRSRGSRPAASAASDGDASASAATSQLNGALCSLDISRIHLFGRSLGGAVALQLAAADHERLSLIRASAGASAGPPPIAGVIVENSFTSLEDMVLVLAGRMGLVRPARGSPEEAEQLAQAAQAEREAAEARRQADEDEEEEEQRGSSSSSSSPPPSAAAPQRPHGNIPIPAALGALSSSAAGGTGGFDPSAVAVVNEGKVRRFWRAFLWLLMTNRWDSLSAVRRMGPHTPLLFCSGLADELVPSHMMSRLHGESAAAHPAAPAIRLRSLHTVERGTHNDTHIRGGMLYFNTIAAFFAATQQREAMHQQQQQSHGMNFAPAAGVAAY